MEKTGHSVWAAPNTPFEVPPDMELPVSDPNRVGQPDGLGSKRLLLELFCSPNTDWEELDGLDDLPNARVEDEVAKLVLEEKGDGVWAAPNTPVEVPLDMELHVSTPNRIELPDGLGAKRLLLELFCSPNTDWEEPDGLDDLPKAGVEDKVPKLVLEERGDGVWTAPNTPVEVPLDMELHVSKPNRVELPDGVGAKRLLLELFCFPNTNWEEPDELDDWLKAVKKIPYIN